MLSEIPSGNVIERIGFESRLESAKERLKKVEGRSLVYKAKLTFRGRPVVGSHGISADFASKSAGAFSDAVAAVAAGVAESLRYMGPIPDKQKNQLLITGTAIGSFGFEFELPQAEEGVLFPEPSNAENALQKLQDLFRLAAEGTDDEIAEIVDCIHPRAVKKAADFLNYIAQQDAWCGLEFKNQHFRFENITQLRESASRLQEDNIIEKDEQYVGEFQGILPASRTFEFKLSNQKGLIRGKVGLDIEDADVLNREFLHKPATVFFHALQVGQGRPRFTLPTLDKISVHQL